MLLEYNELSDIFSAEGIDISPEKYEKLSVYAGLLTEWNEKINLTGITDPRGIALKHFLDSIIPLKFINIPENASLIDVGTGAGFPGLPMKIYRPDIKLTLLDSLNKRINFLSEVCKKADISAECIHERAETGGHSEKMREKFDIAAARAVAAMPVLAEYCLPYVKTGGIFCALKGPNEDIKAGEKAVKILGGEISDIKEYSLPDGDKRVLAVISKISPTPLKYPRSSSQISKKALG